MKKNVLIAAILLTASLALTGCGAVRQQMPVQTAPAVEAATIAAETEAVSTTAAVTTSVKATTTAAVTTSVKATTTAAVTTAAKVSTTAAVTTSAKTTTTAAVTTSAKTATTAAVTTAAKVSTTAAATAAEVSTTAAEVSTTAAVDTATLQREAEAKALAYVGAGYRVDAVAPGIGKEAVFKIRLVSEEDADETVLLWVGETFCITEDEYNGRSFSAQALYFAAKRGAEAKALAFAGDGAAVILSDAVDDEGTFRVGVAKRGCNSQIDYYYVGKTFVLTEAEWEASSAPTSDGQNAVMNCIGSYSDGNVSMFVAARGRDGAHITVSAANGPFETHVWTMDGTVSAEDGTITVTYQNAAEEVFQYTADGTLNDNAIVSTNGTGTVVFTGSTAVWTDAQAGAAGQVLTWVAD